MAVGTFVQPDFQSQTGTEYKTNIDNAVAVSAVAGKWFAPRQSSPPIAPKSATVISRRPLRLI